MGRCAGGLGAASALAALMLSMASCHGGVSPGAAPGETPASDSGRHVSSHEPAPGVPDSCPTSPVRHGPIPKGGFSRDTDYPWIAAKSDAGKTLAVLFYSQDGTSLMRAGGTMSPGITTKILWIMPTRGHDHITLQGEEVPQGSEFKQTVPNSSGAQYPSVVKVPSPGCWKITAKVNDYSSTIVIPVTKAPRAKVP